MCQEDAEFYPTGAPGHEIASGLEFHCARGPMAKGEHGIDVDFNVGALDLGLGGLLPPGMGPSPAPAPAPPPGAPAAISSTVLRSQAASLMGMSFNVPAGPARTAIEVQAQALLQRAAAIDAAAKAAAPLAPPKTTDEAQQRAALLLAQAAGFPPGSPQNIAYTQQAMAMIQSIAPVLVAHPELAILQAAPAVYDRYVERAKITGYYLNIAQMLAA